MKQGNGFQVLLVEDNDDIRESLATLLDDEGYAVAEGRTAEAGLAQLQQRPFHLVITDYMLPGRTGVWLLEEATRAGLLRETGVLMITAHPRMTALPQGRILHKPLDIDEFLNVVAELIASARARGERLRLAL